MQLIDANELYSKLRKNLGEKNCELTAEHIQRIMQSYLACENLERTDGLSAKVFENKDFGYYKVTINRPDRRKVQFNETAITPLRFDKSLMEPMQFLFERHGQAVYFAENLANFSEELTAWAEQNGYALNSKNRNKVLNVETWNKAKIRFEAAETLHRHFGEQAFLDFNAFVKQADNVLKAEKIKLSAADKKAIYQAVSVYAETAEKVIEKTCQFNAAELDNLLSHLGTTAENLPDFGYYPTGKAGEYVQYATNSDLNDSENIPIGTSIHAYFKTEVQPHISEAWIDLDSVKIGYEISFNKYFYQHKALRLLSEIKADILALEQQAEGLIGEILGE